MLSLLSGDTRELLPPLGAVLAAVLGGQQSHRLLEGTGELALVLIPHGGCHTGDGQVALPEQTGGFPHPQLPHIGAHRLSVHRLESGFQRRGVEQVLPGQLLNGIPPGEILHQAGMHRLDRSS